MNSLFLKRVTQPDPIGIYSICPSVTYTRTGLFKKKYQVSDFLSKLKHLNLSQRPFIDIDLHTYI